MVYAAVKELSGEIGSSEELALRFVDKALHGRRLDLLVVDIPLLLLLFLSAYLLNLLLYLEGHR